MRRMIGRLLGRWASTLAPEPESVRSGWASSFGGGGTYFPSTGTFTSTGTWSRPEDAKVCKIRIISN